MKNVYYENDDITFRGQFEIDNVAQTPDAGSALIKIMEKGRSVPYLSEVAASITGTQLYYKKTDLRKGVFRAFFTASYGTGVDQRTGTINFIVKTKEGR